MDMPDTVTPTHDARISSERTEAMKIDKANFVDTRHKHSMPVKLITWPH